MSQIHFAVLDVGKTNKKITIYDSELVAVQSVSEVFEEIVDSGLTLEPIQEITNWFLDQAKQLSAQYNIKAISATTHGAAFVCLDDKGELTVPMLSYTTDPGEEFHKSFHARFGSADELHLKTGTPSMPGLGCMAKAIFFIQQTFPDEFARTRTILNYPQYFGFLLTGRTAIEKTYIGNHTYLWDFRNSEYSELVDSLGIRELLPDRIADPWEVLGVVTDSISDKTGLAPDTIVSTGIHDSNAALLPYLIKEKTSFVLNSSGSVMVNMRCEDTVSLEEKDLGKVILYNTNAFSEPVRTSIFLGGLEFDIYAGQIKAANGGDIPFPDFDNDLFRRIIEEKRCFIIPSVIPFGMFPNSSPKIVEDGTVFTFDDIMSGSFPEFFKDFKTPFMVLNLSIAIQTSAAIEAIGLKKNDVIYIEGGFQKNDSYTSILSALNPSSPIMLSNLDEATSFGAALLAKSSLEKKNPMELSDAFILDCQQAEQLNSIELQDYVNAFKEYLD